MATTAIKLDKELVDKAQAYAASEGKTLSSIIESFLSRLTAKEQKPEERTKARRNSRYCT